MLDSDKYVIAGIEITFQEMFNEARALIVNCDLPKQWAREDKITSFGIMMFMAGMKAGITKDRARMKEIYDSVEEFIPVAEAIQDILLKTAKIDGNA